MPLDVAVRTAGNVLSMSDFRAEFAPADAAQTPADDVTSISIDVRRAAGLLREGKLVAFPTETVYGLGADATNPVAVARIFESKNRPTFDPLIVHVADFDHVFALVTDFPASAQLLAKAIWPGPLTLVLPRSGMIPDLVTAGLSGVGIRIPRHPLAIELLSLAGCPVAAPSANPFGRISPTTAAHVRDGLAGRVDCILDGGPCHVGLESTVVSFLTSQPTVLRPGGCPVEDIEQIIGPVLHAKADTSRENSAQPSPGMLSRHYAPRTRLLLIEYDQPAVPIPGLRCGLLTEGTRPRQSGFAHIQTLCSAGDLRTCAARFFAALRSLDSEHPDVIIAHTFPEHGLGIALNDRLKRAATGSESC